MHKTRRTILLAGLAALVLALLPVLTGAGACNSKSTFYVPKADKGATQQIVSLLKKHDFKNAALLQKMVSKGHAVWLVGGTPADVKKLAKKTMRRAHAKHQIPVFALYNIPGRDCSGYSAGGATDAASYAAWIEGVAEGIGAGKALVILEPDSLGLLPQTDCGSTDFTDADRYAELSGALDRLNQLGNVSVYLDATHSNWMAVPKISTRLITAGVARAAGFFLNASNYQYTANLVQYGTWISKCIANGVTDCADIYWNGGPPNWVGVSMSPFGQWSDTATDPALNTAGINARQAPYVGTTHFVIDTSRNGLGMWDYRVKGYPDANTAQDWCNAPNRGNGIAPTTNTGNPLIDAYLWIKVPGESDGQCTRGTAGPADPEWGITDPVAGEWFPQMALQLAQNANPALN
jgi:endoglucanase